MYQTPLLVPVGAHIADTTISTPTAIPFPAGATGILIQALGQNVRYTLDGSTPSASNGFRLTADNDPIMIAYAYGMAIWVIEESAGGQVQAQAVREVAR